MTWTTTVLSQTDSCAFVIQGAVYDQATQLPLAFATVQLEGEQDGVYTNEKGIFEFPNLCKKEYNLQVSYIGYKTATHHHDFHHSFVEILLAPKETMLKSIVVAEHSDSDLETGTTNKISGKELAAVKTESFGEVVSQIAGVSTINTGQNVSKPMIHGLHSNRILVINNGLRHEFQNWVWNMRPKLPLLLLMKLKS